MGVLEDIRNLIKEVPIIRELWKIPHRMDELEARVSALEKAPERVPGDACPRCGARAMRLQSSRLGTNYVYRFDTWSCGECQHSEERKVVL